MLFSKGISHLTLLGYLNSSLATFFVRGVLIRSNMVTAGYVSRIPIPNFSDATKQELAALAKAAHDRKVDRGEANLTVKAIDRLVFAELAISDQTRKTVDEFVSDLVKRT